VTWNLDRYQTLARGDQATLAFYRLADPGADRKAAEAELVGLARAAVAAMPADAELAGLQEQLARLEEQRRALEADLSHARHLGDPGRTETAVAISAAEDRLIGLDKELIALRLAIGQSQARCNNIRIETARSIVRTRDAQASQDHAAALAELAQVVGPILTKLAAAQAVLDVSNRHSILSYLEQKTRPTSNTGVSS
jgi:hypothetical protein